MKQINFYKYHGCGNDFIIVKETEIANTKNLNKLIVDICNRYTGVGADGFIIVKENPISMEFYNQDGSSGTMCGNGIRSLSAFLIDERIVNTLNFEISTKAGIMKVTMLNNNPYIFKICLGEYSLNTHKLGIKTNISTFINQEITYNGVDYTVNAVFIGVKHLVIFIENKELITEEFGKYLSNYPLFIDQINVNFVYVIDENNFYQKTYERGVGFTNACGTGACASLIIGKMLKKCGNEVNIHMELGILKITLENNQIMMEGPSKKICQGIYEEEE